MDNQSTSEKRMRQQRRKQKQRRRIILTFLAIVFAYLAGYMVGSGKMKPTIDSVSSRSTDVLASGDSERKTESPVQIARKMMNTKEGEITVETPEDYSEEEVMQKLESQSGDERYDTILSQLEDYPYELLKDLANNPEMASFVANYPDLLEGSGKGNISKKELDEKCPLFLQWDKRWGAFRYGEKSVLAVSGCGPTALSMVIVGLTHNKEATPDNVADFSMNNGYYLQGTGTKWSLMTEGAAQFGISSEQLPADKEQMEKSLDEGGFLICSMGRGDFTLAGHFIVIYDYNEKGFKVNDPFCLYRSNQEWTYSQLENQIKSVWVLKNEV